jgi:AraC family transcriptional activator of pobA
MASCRARITAMSLSSLSRPLIPSFTLYGEPAEPVHELLHIEEIQSRSRGHDWDIQPHLHHGLYQVVWIREGSARVALDTDRQEVSGPVAVIVPPGIVHGFRFAPETQGRVLTLGGHFLVEGELDTAGQALRELFAGPRVLCFEQDDPAAGRLDALLCELAAEFITPGMAGTPPLRWLSLAVVWHLAKAGVRLQARGEGGPLAHHQALFTRFVLQVEARYLEHWPVARYAAQLGVSIPRLNRLIRVESGNSALALIHERLTREACRLLLYTTEPVTGVALSLGFEDPAYFCRFIKRRTGLSPSRYREAHAAG